MNSLFISSSCLCLSASAAYFDNFAALGLSSPITPISATDDNTPPSDLSWSRQIGGALVEEIASVDLEASMLDLFSQLWPLGSSLVTYFAADTNEPTPFTTSCSFFVRVRDVGPPLIVCPADVYTRWSTGWAMPVVSDLIDPSPIVQQISGSSVTCAEFCY